MRAESMYRIGMFLFRPHVARHTEERGVMGGSPASQTLSRGLRSCMNRTSHARHSDQAMSVQWVDKISPIT